MTESFIVFDDYYIVEIDRAFYTKDNNICFSIADDIGIFRFTIPEDNMVEKNSWLGRFLHLTSDKILDPHRIMGIVSTQGELDTYLVPIEVRFLRNKHKKRRIPYEKLNK